MSIYSKIIGLLIGLISFVAAFSAQADINRVRVVNDTDKTIYVHVGGFATSDRIEPGKWKIFNYPFETTPPGAKEPIRTSLIVASSGGKWVTTPNGYTYLNKPTLMICLDYKTPEHAQKTGNRVWTIKSANGFDQGCEVKGYKQSWYKDTPQTEQQHSQPSTKPPAQQPQPVAPSN